MKRSIYVVDDQTPVVEMTVAVLRHLNKDWEMKGFTDPLAALDAARTEMPDAVLSDQMMPGLLGSELLEQLRVLSPMTVRLIMSGCVTIDKLALITSAHQYIAKPFDAMKLRDLLERSFAAQQRIVNRGLQKVATAIRAIPSLPHAHHSLLTQLRNSDTPGATIAVLVGKDPGLSVKVLQLANSGLFGHGYLVTDLVDAVNCLGTDMIIAILLSQSVFKQYESLQNRKIDLPRVWAHCWETACIAQRLCREKKLPRPAAEEGFLAGLLHEVGRFVLIDNFPDQYESACQAALQSKTPLAACLRETFQASPPQLAAYVLELWGLPAGAIHSISLMETPQEDPAPGFSLTAALYIADHLASRKSSPDSFALEDWKTDYLQSLGCAEEVSAWEQNL